MSRAIIDTTEISRGYQAMLCIGCISMTGPSYTKPLKVAVFCILDLQLIPMIWVASLPIVEHLRGLYQHVVSEAANL